MKPDAKLINPFIKATVTALEMMAMVKPKRTDIYVKEDSKLIGDISGIMGLSGDVAGAIVVSFEKDAACKIIANMLGEEKPEMDNEVKDGIGEIVNLIAGQAKTMLAETQYHFKVSIPTTIIGSGHEIKHVKGVPCIVAKFDIDGSIFTVEVSIAPKSQS